MFTNHKWAHVDGDPHTSLCKCLVEEGGDQKEVICMSQFANELFGFWLMEGGIFWSIYEPPEKSMAEHSTCPALPFALQSGAQTQTACEPLGNSTVKSIALILVTERNLDTHSLPVTRSCSQQLNCCWASASTVGWVRVGLFALVQSALTMDISVTSRVPLSLARQALQSLLRGWRRGSAARILS